MTQQIIPHFIIKLATFKFNLSGACCGPKIWQPHPLGGDIFQVIKSIKKDWQW